MTTELRTDTIITIFEAVRRAGGDGISIAVTAQNDISIHASLFAAESALGGDIIRNLGGPQSSSWSHDGEYLGYFERCRLL